MDFSYKELMVKGGFSEKEINLFSKYTGYGRLYRNYKLATEHNKLDMYDDVVIPINQCSDCDYDKSLNNCFVIFQSDFLPQAFIKVIKRQTGYILVNSKWMKNVVLNQTNCAQQRIIILPYLQDFSTLQKIKTSNVVKKDKDKITFYTIADYKDVKGLKSLVQAFGKAFDGKNDVQLIIKTYKGGQLDKLAHGKSNIKIISKMLSDIQIYKLHLKSDVYISTAYCAGWQIPPFRASYFGNHLISGYHSALTQWIDPKKATILQSYKQIMPLRQYDNNMRFSNKHDSGWLVNVIDVEEIIDKLIHVYNNYDILKNSTVDVTKFDIRNIDDFLIQNIHS